MICLSVCSVCFLFSGTYKINLIASFLCQRPLQFAKLFFLFPWILYIATARNGQATPGKCRQVFLLVAVFLVVNELRKREPLTAVTAGFRYTVEDFTDQNN